MLHKKLCVAAVLLGLAAGAFAYEIRVSRINTWELTFDSKPPRVLQLVDNGQLDYYTYIVYTVTNKGAQTVDFYPAFQIETEDAKIYTAQIFPQIARTIDDRYHLDALDKSEIAGFLKPGETKTGIAIIKNVDSSSKSLTVYVTGLSGDLKSDTNAKGELVVFYRTFKMVYWRPGDGSHVVIDPVILKSSEWVWRE
jgi:hypothetical protein